MRRHFSVLVPALMIAASRAAGEDDALAQCGSRDPDVAIKACTVLIETSRVDSENLPRIIAQRASAHAGRYDYDRAIKDYSHAIKLRPEFWIAFDGRGLAHANRLNFELAIKDYDQAIKLKPDAASAYYHRGLAKFGLCDLDGADADIAKAREIDPHVGD
jgi:tetratricopeptide (TPR) repeat protein